MGKFRSKLKGQTKGKRWPKGQSSSSNPETKKHRTWAKSRFFLENIGSSNLTSDALRKHDVVQSFSRPKTYSQGSRQENMDEDGMSSISSYQTVKSFASEWSDCTNMSYNRFLNVFRSDSAMHKEMLAILAAVTEVIKEKGGKEEPTEYFCALYTTLETIWNTPEKNETQVTAVLSLLNMGIKSVPAAVLLRVFDDACPLILTILNDYSSGDNNVIIKSLIGIIGQMLVHQENWSKDTKQHSVFNILLNPFCIHTKPKWRKAAQKTVAAIILGKDGEGPNKVVAEFCIETLENCLGGNSNVVLLSAVQAKQTTILHTLGFMNIAIPGFPSNFFKKCIEVLLRLLTLNYPIVSSCCLQVLHTLYAGDVTIPMKVVTQTIVALYEYQPSSSDVQPNLAWLKVMEAAHIYYSKNNDKALSTDIIPKFVHTTTQMWLSDKVEIISGATHTLEALLQELIQYNSRNDENISSYKSSLGKCFGSIEGCLSYQYHTAWHHVLHTIGVMFEVGKECSDLLLNCLKLLSELRDTYKFSYNNELEHAVGAAVRHLGPEVVMSVIPMTRENGEMNLDRSWLMPVLKENIKKTTLSFWINNILPLALFCHKKSAALAEKNDGIGSHSYELLYMQLWSLLPCFCHYVSDIQASFKGVAKVLGTAISDRKELRLSVMAFLRKLIEFAKQSDIPGDADELARFAKNYLPILFNVYTTKPIGTDEEGQRLAALDTIKVYLTITKSELSTSLFQNALTKLQTTDTETDELFVKESLMDLTRVLIPYQSCSDIQTLYDKYIKLLPDIKQQKEQKKVYRLLEEICSCNSDNCKAFIKQNLKSVQQLLMKSLESVVISSKGARLRCLIYLVKYQPLLTHESKLLRSIVPEAILCCKDINEKCRAAAYELLKCVGETLHSHGQMLEFITMLIAGLAGNGEMVSCTILALTSLLHNFSGMLLKENIDKILENVCVLMTSATREVVASCFSFIKVYTATLSNMEVLSSLGPIVKAMCSMTEDCKRHFRLPVRDILDKFVRKYGCDSITPFIPESDTVMYKRLRNLRKLNARKKRQKHEKDDEEEEDEFLVKTKHMSVEDILADSESEIEDMETNQPKQKSAKKKQSKAWIEEDVNNIVDFKDPKTVGKITAVNPTVQEATQVEKKKDRGFKTSTDGRLIISGNSDDESDTKKKKFGFNSDSEDSDDDDKSKADPMLSNNLKRKRSETASVKSGFSQGSGKYKAGGSGIHRPVGSSAASVKSDVGSEYKSKKAKGDMKKKGKVDPYAYLPLQRSLLNKRKVRKNAGKFKNIIGGAKAGARKGKKAKNKTKL